MHLFLSSHSPWNCTYSTEDGQVLYKVECPWKLVNRKATISRALPGLTLPTSERQLWDERHFLEKHPSSSSHPELDGQGSGSPHDDLISEERRSIEYNHEFREVRSQSPTPHHHNSKSHPVHEAESFVHVADIEFHTIQSTRLVLPGEVFTAREFFKTEGWSWFGKDRIFTTPDGKRYKWKLIKETAKLYLLSESEEENSDRPVEELVAGYHPQFWSSFSKRANPPSLEILPLGRAIVDLIVVTFVYIEKLRSERETSSRSSTALPVITTKWTA